MPTYAVQDSDWDWLTEDGNAVLVEAETPEEAVRKAIEAWRGESACPPFDGIHVKVAELRLVGWQGYDREEGFDPFLPFHNPQPLKEGGMQRDEITICEGDRLWPLMSLIRDTHIDDLDEDRLTQIGAMIRRWRITQADGSPLPETEIERLTKIETAAGGGHDASGSSAGE